MAAGLKQNQNKQIFPDMPRSGQAVDKDGHLTPVWHQSIGQVYQALQRNFSNEGLKLPWLSEDEINNIAAIYAPYVSVTTGLPQNIPDISGSVVYDKDNYVPKIFVIEYNKTVNPWVVTAAAWKTFTIT